MKLTAWAQEKNCIFDAFEIQQDSGNFFFLLNQLVDPFKSSRKVVTAKELPVGSLIASIPNACILSESVCDASIVGRKMNEYLKLHPQQEAVLCNHGQYAYGISVFKMAFYILYERFIHPMDFYPYLVDLPEEFNLPICWSQEKLHWLKGSFLIQLVEQRKIWLSKAFDMGKEIFSTLEEEALRESMHQLTFEQFQWAYSAIASRAFPKKSNNRNEICLWPVLDLLNHSHDSKIEWIINEEGVQFIAQESIPKGVELFNNYGPKGNENLLLNYGFVLENNPYDYVKISINTHANATREHYARLHFENTSHLLYLNEDLPPSLIATARFLSLNLWEISRMNESFHLELPRITLLSDFCAFQQLYHLFEQKLLQLDEIKTHDKDIYECKVYQKGQIDILTHHLKKAQEHLQALQEECLECDALFFLESEHVNPEFWLNQEQWEKTLEEEHEWDDFVMVALLLIHEQNCPTSHWRGFLDSLFSPKDPIVNEILGSNLEKETSFFMQQVQPIVSSIALQDYLWAIAVILVHEIPLNPDFLTLLLS